MGDRFSFLIQGMEQIEKRIGSIRQLSRPYETAAWGFEGPPFINACLRLETRLSPVLVLEELKAIEKAMGRTPKTLPGYHSRTLDLDLLFYGTQQIDTTILTVPHPLMVLRRFVLDPLLDLDPEWIHPSVGVNIKQLQRDCTDTTPLTVLSYAAWLPSLFEKNTYWALSGNIGSGKTYLTQQLASDFAAVACYEKFDENPHLAEFYKDQASYALATETFFLESRVAQLQHVQKGPLVSDYWLNKSLIFARISLSSKDFTRFRNRYETLTKEVIQPDVLVYLHRPVDELLLQIKKRGRPYEQAIQKSYLVSVSQGYEEKLEQSHPFPIHIYDCTGKDFSKEPLAYIQLLRQLARV